MRALNSRRPQLTSTRFCLFPRPFFCLLVLLVVHGGRTRSVTRDEQLLVQPGGKLSPVESERHLPLTSPNTEEDSAPGQVRHKLLDPQSDGVENEKVQLEEPGSVQGKISEQKISAERQLQEAGQDNAEQLTDQYPRKDASPIDQELNTEKKEEEKIDEAKKIIGKIGVEVEGSEILKKEDEEATVAKKRRRNDVALVGKTNVHGNEEIPVERIDELKDEGIRRFDVQVDADEGVAGQVNVGVNEAGARQLVDAEQVKEERIKSVVKEEGESARVIESSEQVNHQKSRVQEAEEPNEELPSYFRKSGLINSDQEKEEVSLEDNEEDEESNKNRGHRYLDNPQTKSRRKSSTVYLNAEEKKIPDGEQQSIVDGQIKKLISIRDDALDAQKVDNLDEAKVLTSKRQTGLDEAVFTQEIVQAEQENKVKAIKIFNLRQSVDNIDVFDKWKQQAVALQDQIRNRTFLLRLKEQSSEVLPEIPMFTENQLLNILEQIVLSKRSELANDSYASIAKDLGLTDRQLQIIKCAEQLLAVHERQSFVSNVVECIQGLSVWNCLRIFVWPVIVDNLPQNVVQSLDSLPIEINVFDLFQGNRPKSGRAQNIQQVRLITPESVVYNILQDALESYPHDETLVSYIDPQNETLKDLLTSNQLDILQMAEKLLPQALRREYSDSMFSCVRRFEYFSCVKYFAWPMIKQYFPALPAFPDYQSWYPIFDLYPQYPILPFPTLSGDVGELPEVVDADATRSRRPRPEAVIIQVLQNTLKEQPRLSVSPSFLDQSADSYIALIPQDQLIAINMAEKLIPVAYRPEFVEKTVQCMKEYNYLTCIKYSTWPTVRQFIPNLPDISGLLPDFQIPEYFTRLPLPNLGPYWQFEGSPEQPEIPAIFWLKNPSNTLQSSSKLEAKMIELLLKVRESAFKSPEISSLIFAENMFTFSRFSRAQLDILRLAESLIPSVARPGLITEVIVYLQRSDSFIECARYVIWPTIARYVPNLPEFPSLENKKEPIHAVKTQAIPELKESAISPSVKVQERVISEAENEKTIANRFQDEESRNKAQQNVPVISVTGTRFVPIFTEHPETVILNIVRSVQLQTLNLNHAPVRTTSSINSVFYDLINEQQQNIVNIVDSLIPDSIRTEFTDKLIACLQINNFLSCSRDVIWPTLMSYFPWLPNFPNFGSGSSPSNNNSSPTSDSKQNLTEPSSNKDNPPLSETDVMTGQHGDTTVTITDTRFVPIYNELPETVILNILKAVQLSLPNIPGSPAPVRIQEFPSSLTEHQLNIVQLAENLLPIPARVNYLAKLGPCLKNRSFLECTRDITWPMIAQAYPWLPNFPNFGVNQNMPRIRLHMFLSEKSQGSNIEAQPSRESLKAGEVVLLEAEARIEDILSNALNKSPKLDRSKLDISDSTTSHLTKRQENIVKLAELGIPDSARPTYVARIQECTKGYTFVTCMQNIGWPTLKQYLPSLPDFSEISALLPQLPPISIDPIPPLPDLGPIQTIPGLSELPSELPQLVQQVSDYSAQGAGGAQLLASEVQGVSAFTPSVDNEGTVPGYAGQPPGIFIDISKEKVQLSDVVQSPANAKDSKRSDAKSRERRSVELMSTYYKVDETPDSPDSSSAFPNITESEYLQLLIKLRERSRIGGKASSESKEYFADTLNNTIRNTLTADQYEIVKIVEDVDTEKGRGLAQQIIQCITGFSFIRCVGIFVWPIIVSNFPILGIIGRSLDTENQVHEFFGMSTSDFEKEMLERKDSIEHFLLDWYKKVVEDKFQTNVGFLKIRGYGNGELGISFSGFREGRGAKLKDNKNLPSILTIISDIMEEVLDQRPESEKPKREKEKREKSIDISREGDIQLLKDSEEYIDIKRSMNDDEIITMFLDKIKSNDSNADSDNEKYFGLEDAYNAFGVLFGPQLHSRLAHKLQSFDHQLRALEEAGSTDAHKDVEIVSLESQDSQNSEELKVLPLRSQVAYDLEKESSRDQEQMRRQKRAKNLFKSFLEKHSSKSLKESIKERLEDLEDNNIVDDLQEKEKKSSLVVKLPRLDDEILPKKMTNSMVHLGRAMKNKMMQMMPGLGLVLSFLIQMAVAHARAAASMAGMISNMAMGSAIIGMIRDSFLGANNHPEIKYVYDNHKTGPGITWPSNYESDSSYHG